MQSSDEDGFAYYIPKLADDCNARISFSMHNLEKWKDLM